MEEKKHIVSPIQYFENLIYYKDLNKIKQEFVNIDEEESMYVSYDKKTEILTYLEQNYETGEWEEVPYSFEDHLYKSVTNEAVESLKKIDILILNQDSFEKKTELANLIIENLFFLLKSLDNYPEGKKYEIITRRINNIIAHINTKHSRLIGGKISSKHKSITYVSPQRIKELSQIESSQFDMSRLIRMLEELNIAYINDAFISCGIIVRSILDHIPPIFGKTNFKTFASQCQGKTEKKLMGNLENSSRKIADSLLHSPIEKREILPTEIQVDSKKELDVLLAKIVKELK